jgi:hypothetical protein
MTVGLAKATVIAGRAQASLIAQSTLGDVDLLKLLAWGAVGDGDLVAVRFPHVAPTNTALS